MADQPLDLSSVTLEDIETVGERHAVAAGFYPLKIETAEYQMSKKGSPMIKVLYSVVGQDASLVGDWMLLPTTDMEESMRVSRTRDLKRFCHAFDVPADAKGIAIQHAIGQQADCELTVEQDDSGINRNRVRLPMLPKGEVTLRSPAEADPDPFEKAKKK